MDDELRASIDGVVLALLAGKPDYGYSLMQRLRQRPEIKVSIGNLYPALYRLESDGQIVGEWIESGPRRRRMFSLTPKGRKRLERSKIQWRAFLISFGELLGALQMRGVAS